MAIHALYYWIFITLVNFAYQGLTKRNWESAADWSAGIALGMFVALNWLKE